ncbi:zinc finger MYM-type protein 3-like isoform X2 [Haliotis asinina]|uniref:zinc finger MYM-type protein 3-like isoform X2 n=1 Tax=Haliotis asinina TaxID=109174 RepID=UPI0035326AF5
MEKENSAQFFRSLLENIQKACHNFVNFSQFVEVSGYVCVEIDNLKKERYFLSELLQSSGNVISESYCAQVCKTTGHSDSSNNRDVCQQDDDNCYTSHRKRTHSRQTSFQESDQTQVIQPATLKECTDFNQEYSPMSQSFSSAANFKTETLFEEESSQPEEAQVTLPQTLPKSVEYVACHVEPKPEDMIDLDLFEDELDSCELVSMEEESFPTASKGSASVDSYGGTPNKSKLSPGTLNVVKSSVKQFRRFHFDRAGIDVDLLSTPPEKLNLLLLDYFKEARKIDGRELNARTLKNVQVHLDMFLKDAGYPHSISKDRQFQSCRDYLKRKISEGGKVVAQKHSPVDDNDIETLFQAGQLGAHSPEILTNTMWFLNSKYFAIRRPAEHLGMKWGDLLLKSNEKGQEYLERPINNSFSLKVFAKPQTPNRCFVYFYKQYRAMRPNTFLDEGSPFYLKYDRNQGPKNYRLLSETPSYSSFLNIWRKMIAGSYLPINKKIY